MMNKEIKERIETINKGNVPNGYKKEKWQLFPEEWCKPSQLNTVLKENKERNENLVYGIDDVLSVSGEFGVVNQVDLLGRSYAGESVAPYHIVYTDDIVYTKSPLKQNPHGIIKMNKGKPGIVSTLYAVYHCINPITAQYIETYFSIDTYLNNYLKPLVKRGAKNDMKVNNEDVLKGVIPFPPLEEQQKIAEILSRCDTVIEECEKQVEEYKNLKKTCLSKMFPKKGSNIPEIRFPGFTDAWEQRKLCEFTDSYSGGTPVAGKKEYYDGDIPFIRSGEISSDETELFITNKGLNNSSAKMVKKGDILYALYGATSGEVSISKLKGAINQAILAIQPHLNYDSQFLMQWLRKSKENIINTYLQGGQGNLSGNIVKELLVDLPTYEEQQKIGAYFSNLDSLITLHQRKSDAYTQMKKALTQLLLTGIVRVNKQKEILP